jgi:hypothetical protein
MNNKILYTAKFTLMNLNSTKFGGNRTKDLEVSPDRQTTEFFFDPVTLTFDLENQ